jgi:hypothetical protein
MVGDTLSIIFTFCVQVAVLPEASVAVQITVFVPFGNVAGALLVTLAIEQLSEETGVPKFTPVAEHPEFV